MYNDSSLRNKKARRNPQKHRRPLQHARNLPLQNLKPQPQIGPWISTESLQNQKLTYEVKPSNRRSSFQLWYYWRGSSELLWKSVKVLSGCCSNALEFGSPGSSPLLEKQNETCRCPSQNSQSNPQIHFWHAEDLVNYKQLQKGRKVW